jgi:hypothetical protein
MANSILTMTAVTREALRILHQKANFLGSINRQYDPSFAKSGAKIGDSLKIRLPNQYTVRSGATIQAQDTTETSTTLQVATQKGVDMQFSSADLSLSLDDFSKRIIAPAVNVLVAAVENDALNTMRLDVYNQVDNVAAAITSAKILGVGRKLNDSLAPNPRSAMLNTNDEANSVEAFKTLFHSAPEIGKQYRDGQMGRALGFDFAANTHLQTQSCLARANYQTNDATAQTGSSLTVETGTGAIAKGEVFTIAGVYSVHPETKVSTGVLQQFVTTQAYSGTTTTIAFAPAIVASGATQNVSNGAANDKAVTFLGTASTDYGQSLFYHEDAFTFATADLQMPGGVDMAAREVLDGVSLRMVRAYDINSDNFPCRLDILYGYKTIRPQLACRLANLAPA